MDNIWAGAAPEGAGEPGFLSPDAGALAHADDPLGDEAAFPNTWQQLSPGETPQD